MPKHGLPRRMIMPNGDAYVATVARVVEVDDVPGASDGAKRPRALRILHDDETAELSRDKGKDWFVVILVHEDTIKKGVKDVDIHQEDG